MKIAPIAAALALLVGLSPALLPEAQADPDEAKACLDKLIDGAAQQGRRLRAVDQDSAANGEQVDYRVTLYKGMTYVLLGCADGEGVDLDLMLYDSDGNLVDRDGSPDAQPFVFVEPPKTGEYAMKVQVLKANAKTDFAVAITYQD